MSGQFRNVSNAPTLKDTQGTMVPNVLFNPTLSVDLKKIESSIDEMVMRQGNHYEVLEEASQMVKVQLLDIYGALNDQTAVQARMVEAVRKINFAPTIPATHITVGFHWAAVAWMFLAPPLCALLAYLAVKYL